MPWEVKDVFAPLELMGLCQAHAAPVPFPQGPPLLLLLCPHLAPTPDTLLHFGFVKQ